MNKNITEKKYVLCISGEGTFFDSRPMLHWGCLGLSMIEEWKLEQWKVQILNRWKKLRLGHVTRGINRFRGLALALKEVDGAIAPIFGINEFIRLVLNTEELTVQELERHVEEAPIFSKVISWSNRVDERISNISLEEDAFFEQLKQVIVSLNGKADCSLFLEMEFGGGKLKKMLMELPSYVTSVVTCGKADRIKEVQKLIDMGYEKNNILYCSDIVEDARIAEQTGILFFPVMAGIENESWERFKNEGMQRWLTGRYDEAYQEQLKNEFYSYY